MSRLENTVRLYPALRAASGFLAWIPVFFLYLSSHWSLSAVLTLSGLYYITVFVLEVPSGYLSDRLGRRPTLLLGAGFALLASLLFVLAGQWWVFVAANMALAASIALQSGSDTALHYDALKSLGRESEYQAREARAETWGMVSLAAACLLGGALGSLDLRLAYALSACGALVAILLLLRMQEPPASDTAAPAFFTTLGQCIGRLRDPLLAWVFAAMIGLYALAHIVYELYQPFTTAITDTLAIPLPAPALSGLIIGASMFGGALAAQLSVAWRASLGLFGLIAVATVLQAGVALALAVGGGVFGLLLVTLRNFPMSLLHAPVNDAIAPRISSAQRATFLSLLSLLERLVFALLLFGLGAVFAGGDPASAANVQPLLFATLALAAIGALVLVLAVPAARRALDAP